MNEARHARWKLSSGLVRKLGLAPRFLSIEAQKNRSTRSMGVRIAEFRCPRSERGRRNSHRIHGFGLLVLLCAAAALWLTGCTRGSRAPDEQTQPVDAALLSFLSRARAAHHRADMLEDSLRLEQALAELGKVLGGPMPPGGGEMPEVREVLADTRARAADLSSRLGRFEQAEADIRAGLDQSRETSYFRGHLLEVRGLVEERRARFLAGQARQILERADARWGPDSPEALRRDALLRQLSTSQESLAKPDASRDASLQAARRELDQLRRARLTEPEQRELSALLTSEQAARQRALDAFEQSMQVQAQVIENTAPSSR
jgi:tetratricopeptide (TPR) repeat protein